MPRLTQACRGAGDHADDQGRAPLPGIDRRHAFAFESVEPNASADPTQWEADDDGRGRRDAPCRGPAIRDRRLRPGVITTRTHALSPAASRADAAGVRVGLRGSRTATLRWFGRDGGVLDGVVTLLQSGDTAAKIDLVFLGDGFTRGSAGRLQRAGGSNGKRLPRRASDQGAAQRLQHPPRERHFARIRHRQVRALRDEHRHRHSDVSRRTALDSGYMATAAGNGTTAAWAPPTRRSPRGSPPTLPTTTSSSCS